MGELCFRAVSDFQMLSIPRKIKVNADQQQRMGMRMELVVRCIRTAMVCERWMAPRISESPQKAAMVWLPAARGYERRLLLQP
jgi:hypothetical protein